jgi:hypothetical protein
MEAPMDKRLDYAIGEFVDVPEDVALFLDELAGICEKYGFSLAHEDSQGAFIVEPYKKENIYWLLGASLRFGGAPADVS